MTDKEKANEISHDTMYVVATGKYSYTSSIVENMCLQMAAWKQDQLIENTYRLLVEKYFFTEDEAKKFIEDLKAMLQ